MDRVRRNIMISANLDRELEAMARAVGETRSGLITRALARYMDDLDLDIARERALRHEKGETRSLTPAEMRRALAL